MIALGCVADLLAYLPARQPSPDTALLLDEIAAVLQVGLTPCRLGKVLAWTLPAVHSRQGTHCSPCGLPGGDLAHRMQARNDWGSGPGDGAVGRAHAARVLQHLLSQPEGHASVKKAGALDALLARSAELVGGALRAGMVGVPL